MKAEHHIRIRGANMKLHVKRHAVVQPSDPTIKLIPLTRNLHAIVDAADYEQLAQHKWYAVKSYKTSYAVRSTYAKGQRIEVHMHREILGLKRGDGLYADHRNHNGLDNRRANLRLATSSQNGFNQRRRASVALSGIRGVHIDRGVWTARIRFGNKVKYLGRSKDKAVAEALYRKAAIELYGEFAEDTL